MSAFAPLTSIFKPKTYPLTRLYVRLFCLGAFSALFSPMSRAEAEFVEFDPSFLAGFSETNPIDVRRFSYGNHIPEGEYIADIKLNGQNKGRIAILFVEDEEKQSQLCATIELLRTLDLTAEAVRPPPQQKKLSQNCPLFSQAVPEAKTRFDLGSLTLEAEIPQALITQRPRGYIAPNRWQTGVPVGFVRYYANHYQSDYQHQNYHQTYLSLDAGINLGGWALRHRGSQSWLDGKRNPYQRTQSYAQRDIATWRSQLTIGDFYTSGLLLDSVGLRGLQLASDERMLPNSVRGYAPVVRGVAHSNALVVIRQKDAILREVSVPAGAFVIDDLYPTGYGGDLEVEIREAYGEIRRFTVPFTAEAQLMRLGYGRYFLAAGRYRYSNRLSDKTLVQGTWQYGLTNDITINLGGIIAKHYRAELLGLSFNTPIGAFSANATFSNASFARYRYIANSRRENVRGYSFYASYNTRIESTDTNLTLAAYRYFSPDYYSLSDFMNYHQQQESSGRAFIPRFAAYRPKNQFQLNINQNLKDNWGQFYLTASHQAYWGRDKKQFDLQFGYNNSYRKLNYRLAFYQTRNAQGRRDQQLYLSFSLPLGKDNPLYLTQDINQSRLEGLVANTNLSGSLGQNKRYSYNLSLSHQSKTQHNSISVNHSYLSPYARFDNAWSKAKDSQQLSFGVSGAVVAHPKGVSLANDLSDTFAIIHAKGADGAKIYGSIGNEIDRWGNGIVPYLTPYSLNSVGIDINSIPDTIELSATQQEVIPRANTALLINFESSSGSVVFFELQQLTSIPPLGTDVFNQAGDYVGVVAQGGRIYTRGVAQQGALKLNWGDHQCQIDYRIDDAKFNQRDVVIVPVTCQQ